MIVVVKGYRLIEREKTPVPRSVVTVDDDLRRREDKPKLPVVEESNVKDDISGGN